MNASLRGLFSCVMLVGCAGQTPPVETAPPAATEATQPAPVTSAATVAPAASPAPVVATPAAAVAQPAQGSLVVKGLSTPESALYDAANDVYLVSNINGSPVAVDDNGFISKIAPDGTIVELKWIDGAKDSVKLNAPKGMAIADGVLYVSDIDTVRKFDAKSGEPKGEIKIKGTTFLNDIAAAPNGTIYVTDSGLKLDASGLVPDGTDAVYEIVKDKAKTLIKGKDLKGPNGVLVDDTGVWIVTFGANELYNVKGGKKSDVKTLPKGGLDGIVKTNAGRLLISSWEGKQVFGGSGAGSAEAFTALVSDVNSPADIGYDSKRNLVLIPQFMENQLQVSQLP